MESLRKDLSPIRMRNYGRILQDVVAYASTMEDEAQRKAMIVYLAQCMRQKNLVWNKDQESGFNRVKADIEKLSDGALSCDFSEFDQIMQQMAMQRRKKK